MAFNTLAKKALILMPVVISASVVAAPQTTKQMIAEMREHATKPTMLPKSRTIVMFGKRSSEALVVLDNPRWVVKGELFDAWQNQRIADLSELNSASKLLPLNTMNVDFDKALTINTNSSKSKKLTVFLDPFKKTTPKDLEVILKYASNYALEFVLFTKERSESEVKKLFTLACDLRGLSVNKQLAMIMNQSTRIGSAPCEQDRVISSYGVTSLFGIQTSPAIVASNYAYSEGFPEQFTNWLTENMK